MHINNGGGRHDFTAVCTCLLVDFVTLLPMHLYFENSVEEFHSHKTLFTLMKLLSSLFSLIRCHINLFNVHKTLMDFVCVVLSSSRRRATPGSSGSRSVPAMHATLTLAVLWCGRMQQSRATRCMLQHYYSWPPAYVPRHNVFLLCRHDLQHMQLISATIFIPNYTNCFYFFNI